ncbi:hypothetical protein GCM10018987_23020 [Streptomyces cremeus]
MAKARARGGRLDAAEEFQGGVVEQLGVVALAGGVLDDQDGDVVVVVGGDPEGAHQAVADDLRGAGRAGEGAFEGGDALVDVLAAALDQAVRVEDGGGAGRQGDRAGRVHPAARAERRARVVLGAVDRAVLLADEDGEMAGGGVDEAALVGVVDGVHAGGDLTGVDLGGEAVQELQDLVRREVEARVGAHGGAELAHHGRRAHAAAHHVADDQGRAAGAEGDHVVPVAADGRVLAAGLVGGGDAQVVRLFQLLREQRALEGDGRFALAAFGGAQPFGGVGVVGDVGGEDQDAAAVGEVQGRAGDRVRAALGRTTGLDRTGRAAAQDLVHQRQQAQLLQFGQPGGGGDAGGAVAEHGGVGVVDVRDTVFGAVDQGDQGREVAEDLAQGEVVEGGRARFVGGRCGPVGRGLVGLPGLAAGGRHGPAVGPGCRAALRSGEPGAPAGEVH